MSGRTRRSQAFIADPDDERHGTINGYANLGCRCGRCRAANARAAMVARCRRSYTIVPDDPRHGTASFYSNHRCRCMRCKRAWAAADRAKTRQEPAQ